jgi:hypothetical protein
MEADKILCKQSAGMVRALKMGKDIGNLKDEDFFDAVKPVLAVLKQVSDPQICKITTELIMITNRNQH